jgi:hypothetical protein
MILEDGKTPVQGYSPFTAEEYKYRANNPNISEQEKGKIAN